MNRIRHGIFRTAILICSALCAGQGTGPVLRADPPERNRPPQRTAPAQGRGAPAHAPRNLAPPRRAPVVERPNHGTLRHVDTHLQQRPTEWNPRNEDARRGFVHHDGDIDIGRSHYWHGFVPGRHIGGLRPGFIRIVYLGSPYFYDGGIYYRQDGDGYQAIYPPVGIGVPGLPDGAFEVDAGGLAYYYAGGAFYLQQGDGYIIAATPIGITVPELPPGAVAVSLNGAPAYRFNGIYYQPVFVNGVTQFMTVLP